MGKEWIISEEIGRMDQELIHGYLSERSYWAKGRSLALVKRSMENSRCFGVFSTFGDQVAFARLVTDYVVFAWLMDVFVVEGHRGKGIGQLLLRHIVELPELGRVNGIGLRTRDAHGFYEQFGFAYIPEPETWMLRRNPGLAEKE